jgi:DASH complex subunit DAM1
MSTPSRDAAPLSTSANTGRQSTSTRRPTTPLRRISASSMRSLSLSHSRARDSSSTEPPLQHLGHVFAEVADAFADLSASFEALNDINNGLDGFNEAFGGYLYGLRINSYCCDFENVIIFFLKPFELTLS